MISLIKVSDATIVARLHTIALQGDFLPSLGEEVLKNIYLGTLEKPNIYSLCFKQSNKIVGFVIGTKDINLFFKEAFKNRFIFIIYQIILAVLKNPLLIKKILETVTYTSKDKGPRAELVVIAVHPKMQGKGIGKMLINELEKTFIENGVKTYKLTVHADKSAVRFYEHLRFKKISSFKLYAKIWYIYQRKIIKV